VMLAGTLVKGYPWLCSHSSGKNQDQEPRTKTKTRTKTNNQDQNQDQQQEPRPRPKTKNQEPSPRPIPRTNQDQERILTSLRSAQDECRWHRQVPHLTGIVVFYDETSVHIVWLLRVTTTINLVANIFANFNVHIHCPNTLLTARLQKQNDVFVSIFVCGET
jgi:hypothetical protein